MDRGDAGWLNPRPETSAGPIDSDRCEPLRGKAALPRPASASIKSASIASIDWLRIGCARRAMGSLASQGGRTVARCGSRVRRSSASRRRRRTDEKRLDERVEAAARLGRRGEGVLARFAAMGPRRWSLARRRIRIGLVECSRSQFVEPMRRGVDLGIDEEAPESGCSRIAFEFPQFDRGPLGDRAQQRVLRDRGRERLAQRRGAHRPRRGPFGEERIAAAGEADLRLL